MWNTHHCLIAMHPMYARDWLREPISKKEKHRIKFFTHLELYTRQSCLVRIHLSQELAPPNLIPMSS